MAEAIAKAEDVAVEAVGLAVAEADVETMAADLQANPKGCVAP